MAGTSAATSAAWRSGPSGSPWWSGWCSDDRGGGAAMIGGLELLIGLPLLGSLVIGFGLRRVSDRAATLVGLALATGTLGLALWAWGFGHHELDGFRLQSDESWVAAIGVHWRLGVDSLSAPLVVVTALL